MRARGGERERGEERFLRALEAMERRAGLLNDDFFVCHGCTWELCSTRDRRGAAGISGGEPGDEEGLGEGMLVQGIWEDRFQVGQ